MMLQTTTFTSKCAYHTSHDGFKINTPHRGAFCQFLFRCHSNKSTGKQADKTRACAPAYIAILLATLSQKNHYSCGPFIYYVITFLVFLDPPPPLRQHVFSTKNKQKLAFSDPPPPLQVLT